MAYVTKYQISFTNELIEDIVISLQKKDAIAGEIINYTATAAKHAYNGQDDNVFSPIIGSSFEFEFLVGEGDPDYWPDFQDMEQDTWRCVVVRGVQRIFEGFILPDEGEAPLQDRPYTAKMTAVDNLSLLSELELHQPDGTAYIGENLIIWYLAGALQQTGLVLPIRVYDNVFHANMLTRNDDPKWNMFLQARLEYRTFLKDAVSYVSAREAIEIILKDNYRLFQWFGQWVIVRLGMIQYTPFVGYYTLHDYNGANAVGHEITEDYATVGKNELIYPIHEDQVKTIKKAIRSTRTQFNYIVWPEAPKNNKFERGNLLSSQDTTQDGKPVNIKTYTIHDWEHGYTLPGVTGQVPLAATAASVYRKITVDAFQQPIDSRIVMETRDGQQIWLRSEGVPVRTGDKISVGVHFAASVDFTPGNYIALRAYIISAAGGRTGLRETGNWQTGNGSITITYSAAENSLEFKGITVNSNEIPVDGTLYIALEAQVFAGAEVYFKDFDFTYTPYLAGGYKPVKGDYWFRTINKKYVDKSESEVGISDATHKIFKGTILDIHGNPTTPQWFRMGVTESKHYKEIGNQERFNLEYRRFWHIEGSFTGTTFAPSNDQEHYQPIGLHKQYRFVDIPGEDRRFILMPPVEIDLIKGWMTARFREVFRGGEVIEMQKETVQNLVARIREAIDNTTALQWDSAGQAPAHGTAGFPPVTGDYLDIVDTQRKFLVYMNIGAEMTVATQGSAVVTRQVNPSYLGYAVMAFAIDNYSAGDILTFTAYGHDIEITVQSVPVVQVADGQQTGTTEFKYIF